MNAADFLLPAAKRIAPGTYVAAVVITTGTTEHQFPLRRRDRNLTVRRFQSVAAAKRAAKRTIENIQKVWPIPFCLRGPWQDWPSWPQLEADLDQTDISELRRLDRRLAWTLWVIQINRNNRTGARHGS
jgi:hypothetical protein